VQRPQKEIETFGENKKMYDELQMKEKRRKDEKRA